MTTDQMMDTPLAAFIGFIIAWGLPAIGTFLVYQEFGAGFAIVFAFFGAGLLNLFAAFIMMAVCSLFATDK